MKNKVSIITVSYNCVKDIEITIQSVINQSYRNMEYLVIDGYSNDGTVDIIRNYSDRISYWISEPDKGIYDAMNKGLEHATGDWVIFINAGDSIYSADTIESFFEQVKSDTDIAHGDIVKLRKGFSYRAKPIELKNMDKAMAVFHQAAFTRLDYHKVHLFDLRYRSAADYNFFYHAYFDDHLKFQYIPTIVANFESNDGTSNSNFRLSQRESMAIRGVKNNWKVRLRKEWEFCIIDLKIWIKSKMFSKERRRQVEMAKAKRDGGTEFTLTDF